MTRAIPLFAAAAMFAVALCAPAQAAPAAAQKIIDGVYGQDPACVANAELGEGVSRLTPSGIEEIEFFCEFLGAQEISDGGMPEGFGFVATSFCMAPGEPFPALISVTRHGENALGQPTLRVVYQDIRKVDQIYHRCAE